MASQTITTPRGRNKTEAARAIFSQTTGFSRKIVIQRFQNELQLTPAAASTYYQTCRREAGLTSPRGSKKSGAQ